MTTFIPPEITIEQCNLVNSDGVSFPFFRWRCLRCKETGEWVYLKKGQAQLEMGPHLKINCLNPDTFSPEMEPA